MKIKKCPHCGMPLKEKKKTWMEEFRSLQRKLSDEIKKNPEIMKRIKYIHNER